GPQHEVGERGGSFPPRERLLLGGPALPVRGVGLAVAAARALAPFGVVAVDPPGVVGERTRRAGDRPAALDDERAVAPDVRGLAGGVGDPVPAPPPALADDAGHGGRARGEAVPAGVDLVERDDPRPCAAGERAGELGLARTRAAVDEQHPGLRPAGEPRGERRRVEFRARAHERGPRMGLKVPAASEAPIAAAAIATPSSTSVHSARPKRATRAAVRGASPPKPRASIAVARAAPRRSASTSSANATEPKKRMRPSIPPASPTPRARRASTSARQSSTSRPAIRNAPSAPSTNRAGSRHVWMRPSARSVVSTVATSSTAGRPIASTRRAAAAASCTEPSLTVASRKLPYTSPEGAP